MAVVLPASKAPECRQNGSSKVIYYGKMAQAESADSKILNKTDDDFANPSQSPPKLDISNMKSLFVDVIVRNAVSPLNFTIQNYRQSQNLKTLESEMSAFYTALNGKSLQFSDLMLHGFYAVKYSNPPAKDDVTSEERWVRCQIMKPFHENMPVLSYLIDHGIYHVTEPGSIQPLLKRHLSMAVQSYEAKLHFVEGSRNQFTPDDCLRFQREVDGKAFCAILLPKSAISMPKSALSIPSEDKLSLILIDTSKNRDEYVHQQFASNKLGVVKGRS